METWKQFEDALAGKKNGDEKIEALITELGFSKHFDLAKIQTEFKKRQGWVRDLTREGVESNPGPSWDEFLAAFKKRYSSDYKELSSFFQTLKGEVKKELGVRVVTTADLKKFLEDLRGKDFLQEQNLENMNSEMIRIIDTLEAPPTTAQQAPPPQAAVVSSFTDDQLKQLANQISIGIKESKKKMVEEEKRVYQDALTQDRFVLVDYLGGSSCNVYSALDQSSNSLVVVKAAPILESWQLSREKAILTILKECDGVPKLISSVSLKGYFFLVEEPIGETLEHQHLSVSDLVDLAPKLVEILLKIHQHGVIHRDLKPSNIIIANSEVTIIDFGVSAYTEKQKLVGFEGTKNFASQAALNGKYASPEDDFTSLCYTLYALEIGQRKWDKQVEIKRPTIEQLSKKSVVVAKLVELWRQSKESSPKIAKKRPKTKKKKKENKRQRL